MKFKDFIVTFASKTKGMIAWLEGYKELSGKEKKERLDKHLTQYVEATIDNIGLNFVLKFALRKILLNNIPTITQCIFDLVKAKVEGVTDGSKEK